MPAKLGYLVIDSVDAERIALFWCSLLAVSVDADIGDSQFLVPESKHGKNRLHLEFVIDVLPPS